MPERYRVAVGLWAVQPSEFWRMTPQEWMWMYDAKVGEPKVGNLPQSTVDELFALLP